MALRIVQVGLGPWGLNWAQEVLPRRDDIVVAARVDADAAVLKAAGSALSESADRHFTTLQAALSAVEADAVLATVPLPEHAAVARAALEDGLHVLVEKPFAATAGDAAALVDLAAAHGRVLMVNQNYRHFPAPIAAADLVAGGILGPVRSVTIDFRRYAPDDGFRYYCLDQPLLSDMAIHHFDLLRMVLDDEPASIACQCWNPPDSGFSGPPAAVATIRFRRGTIVSYRGSWISHGAATPWAGQWRMDCADGEIAWTSRGSGKARLSEARLCVRRSEHPVDAVLLTPLPFVDRAGSLAAFAETIRSGREPARFSSGRDNLLSLALTEAAVASAASRGAPVRVADPRHTTKYRNWARSNGQRGHR